MIILKNIDLRKVRVFYITCNFLALFPPHKYGRKAHPASVRFKIYTIFQILLYLSFYAYTVYGREAFVYKQINWVVAIASRISSLSLTLLNVFMRIHLVLINSLYFQNFLNAIDKLSLKPPFKTTPNKILQLQFFIFSLYMLGLICCDAWVWVSAISWKLYQFFCMEDILFYNVNVMISFAIYAATQIKHFFIALNKLLNITCKTMICTNETKIGYVLDEVNMKKTLPKTPVASLANIRKYYSIICDFIDQFNAIYGLIILMAILSFIFFITYQANILVVYALRGEAKQLMQHSYDVTDLAVMNILWVLTVFLLSALLAYSCATAISEREKLTKTCIFWFNQLPDSNAATALEKGYKEELIVLMQQLRARRPIFSASGFFPVDFTLLGFIIGSVTSFMVVSVQFI